MSGSAPYIRAHPAAIASSAKAGSSLPANMTIGCAISMSLTDHWCRREWKIADRRAFGCRGQDFPCPVRNMMCCTVSGQGAGIAAVSVKNAVSTAEVTIADIQAELKRQGVRFG